MWKNILLYTDIGDDIDDTLALCHLLEYTTHDLLGIITSHGDIDRRNQQAKEVLDRYGRHDIPIIWWSSQPLDNDPVLPLSTKQSISDIISRIDTMTVVCIGPPTDLAKSWRDIPTMHDKTAQVIYQGDCTNTWQPDIIEAYNFRCDPHASLYCHESISAEQLFVGKHEAYQRPMRKSDFLSFSQHATINNHLLDRANYRHQQFKTLNPTKRQEIYGHDKSILSFPYDLVAIEKI